VESFSDPRIQLKDIPVNLRKGLLYPFTVCQGCVGQDNNSALGTVSITDPDGIGYYTRKVRMQRWFPVTGISKGIGKQTPITQFRQFPLETFPYQFS
jgi:hypothetical protein